MAFDQYGISSILMHFSNYLLRDAGYDLRLRVLGPARVQMIIMCYALHGRRALSSQSEYCAMALSSYICLPASPPKTSQMIQIVKGQKVKNRYPVLVLASYCSHSVQRRHSPPFPQLFIRCSANLHSRAKDGPSKECLELY